MKKKPKKKAASKKVGKDAPFPKLGKDAPFPLKDGPFPMKDGPFPMWKRLDAEGRFGKDAPFPLVEAGLFYEIVPFVTLYQGNRGPKTAKTGVLRSPSDVNSQLPGLDLPNIDFDREELIFVGLGTRPGNGYKVEISQIMYLTDRGPKFDGPLTSVSYGEYGARGQLDVETYPLHVVKLKKLDGSETQFSRS